MVKSLTKNTFASLSKKNYLAGFASLGVLTKGLAAWLDEARN
jgi:hypothetical protein